MHLILERIKFSFVLVLKFINCPQPLFVLEQFLFLRSQLGPPFLFFVIEFIYTKCGILKLNSNNFVGIQNEAHFIGCLKSNISNGFSADALSIVNIHLNWSLIAKGYNIFTWDFAICTKDYLLVFVLTLNFSKEVGIIAVVPARQDVY
jgi:hypothetical protein